VIVAAAAVIAAVAAANCRMTTLLRQQLQWVHHQQRTTVPTLAIAAHRRQGTLMIQMVSGNAAQLERGLSDKLIQDRAQIGLRSLQL